MLIVADLKIATTAKTIAFGKILPLPLGNISSALAAINALLSTLIESTKVSLQSNMSTKVSKFGLHTGTAHSTDFL